MEPDLNIIVIFLTVSIVLTCSSGSELDAKQVKWHRRPTHEMSESDDNTRMHTQETSDSDDDHGRKQPLSSTE